MKFEFLYYGVTVYEAKLKPQAIPVNDALPIKREKL